ncbi:MAG TPA: hypothetical protein VIX82_00115 [Solirubrobacteraceae bacterium]
MNVNGTKEYTPGGSGLLERFAVKLAYDGSSTATGAPGFDFGSHKNVGDAQRPTPINDANELRARFGDLGEAAVVDALMRLERLARILGPSEHDGGAPAERHAREAAPPLAA